jgi:hypothetical protein
MPLPEAILAHSVWGPELVLLAIRGRCHFANNAKSKNSGGDEGGTCGKLNRGGDMGKGIVAGPGNVMPKKSMQLMTGNIVIQVCPAPCIKFRRLS